MQLWKLMLGLLIAAVLMYGSMVYIFVKVVDEVDNNGGLKAVIERVWEGNKK
jgi:hypothetical protein